MLKAKEIACIFIPESKNNNNKKIDQSYRRSYSITDCSQDF